MNGLKTHKYMDLLTTIAFIISFVIAVVSVILKNWQLAILVDLFIIIAMRIVGYCIDRAIENKE